MLRRGHDRPRRPAAFIISIAIGVLALPAGVVGAAPATAAAPLTYALTLSEVAPVDGFSHEVAVASSSTLDISARLNAPPDVSSISGLFVEVASQNVPGQDGTLSDDNRVVSAVANRTDSDPNVYKGRFYNLSLLAPGTYYWQFYSPCVVTDGSGATSRTCMSPVYTLTITRPVAPLPPPPTAVPVKASSRISLSAKAPWGANGWKVTATLSRNGTPSAGTKLVGQYRTNGSWHKDSAWRTNRYGKLRISFDGETRPTQYRFVFKGNDSTKPSQSKAFYITRRR